MLNRLVVSIVLVIFPLFAFADRDISIAEKMLENLRVDNTKNVVIPGNYGLLKVFFEKSKTTIPHSTVELIYDDKKNTFNMYGKSLAITQDGHLIFAVKDHRVYAKSVHGPKESVKIQFKDMQLIYNDYSIHVDYNKLSLDCSEFVYNRKSNTIKLYKNGQHINSIELQ